MDDGRWPLVCSLSTRANARDLIETEYSWASIATATLASYRCADLGRRGRSPGDAV